MADKIIENNQVSIMGKIDTGFTFSHQVFGEGFLYHGASCAQAGVILRTGFRSWFQKGFWDYNAGLYGAVY